MARRTPWPLGPEQLAQNFVRAAHDSLRRVLAVHGIALVDRMQYVAIVGAGYRIRVGTHEFRGEDFAASSAAQLLTRACVSELELTARARLMRFIDPRAPDALDDAPGHFEVRLDLTGQEWRLAVRACAGQHSASVALLEGDLLPQAELTAA